MLAIAHRIECRFGQLSFNTVEDMAEVKIAVTGQFKQVSLAVLIKVMEVADNKYGGAGQGKASRFFEYMGETELSLAPVPAVAD